MATLSFDTLARRTRMPQGLRALGYAFVAAALTMSPLAAARAQELAQSGPIKGEVKVFTDGGYARMAFRFAEDVPATVSISGAIMVITFKKPVNVSVEGLNSARDYISAARRDPDGSAIRVALAQPVRANTIPAAERLYIDMLPESWKGVNPGLPQEVIDDLSRRTLEAERQLYAQRLATRQKEPPLLRVRVAKQPTFMRYVFPMPDKVAVVPEQGDGKLSLTFDQQIKWDLADARASMPSTLEALDSEIEYDATVVRFAARDGAGIRQFREEKSIIVDVDTDGAMPIAMGDKALPQLPALTAVPAISKPETVIAKDAAPAKEAATTPRTGKAPETKPAEANAADVKVAEPPPRLAADPNAPVITTLKQTSEGLRLKFPFAEQTPAAVFRRADTLWLVFDSPAEIEISALQRERNDLRNVVFERAPSGAGVVRIKLSRPRLLSVDTDGPSWIVNIADAVAVPSKPLTMVRSQVARNRSVVGIGYEEASRVHRLYDSELGDRLLVVTANGPPRGFVKPQSFVEFQTLASAQGVVIVPVADDLAAELANGSITIGRPGGLTLSAATLQQMQETSTFRPLTFDTQLWGYDREQPFLARQSELIRLASVAPNDAKRKLARFALARFFLARDMGSEAKAVLDVALADQTDNDDVTGSLLRAVAEVMIDRPDLAIKDLNNPAIANERDAPIWRGVALARQGKWAEAQKAFKATDAVMGVLPIELQRLAMLERMRAALELRDFETAARIYNDLEGVGVPADQEATVQVLSGRLYEGLGRTDDALANYRLAGASNDRRAAAQGRLREIELMGKQGTMPRKDGIIALETLTTVWRGDATESEGLKLLAHLYTEDGRYREAFHIMRTALKAHADSDLTRKIQDEAQQTFESLFLEGKGDALPAVEALGLFYDYRELTPIGRRGDEMIRRLADRLVSVDLLDQAAELLQHQVDHRLKGAARAQVATRLAIVYLMNRKPDRALATLQATRNSDLAGELRDQRLLIEARALSDTGRQGVALELIANIKGREAQRLRADVMWAAKRWRDAAEQIEAMYGDRWRGFKPLNETERNDVLRAAIGYALADETFGLSRLREKYMPKMAEAPDRMAFDVVSSGVGTGSEEFMAVARRIATSDTLSAFLRDMRARYPDGTSPFVPVASGDALRKLEPAPVAEKKEPGPGDSILPPKAPAGVPLRPDVTSSIGKRAAPQPVMRQR